jgi:hypothetical protein
MTTNHCIVADTYKLMYWNQSTHHRLGSDMYMTGQRGKIGENNTITDLTVMSDMALGHQKAV